MKTWPTTLGSFLLKKKKNVHSGDQTQALVLAKKALYRLNRLQAPEDSR